MEITQLEIYRNDKGNIVLKQDFDEDSFVVITPDMVQLVIQGLVDAKEEITGKVGVAQ